MKLNNYDAGECVIRFTLSFSVLLECNEIIDTVHSKCSSLRT
jgi:hypothetical protein